MKLFVADLHYALKTKAFYIQHEEIPGHI